MVSRRSLLYSLGGIGLGGSVYAGLQSPDDTPAETDAEPASEQTSEPEPDWQPATTAQLTHEFINDNRAQHDHTRMDWHDGLASVASAYAETMGTESFFSHTHDGRNGGERLASAGIDMQTWGENIVYTWWDRPLDDGDVLTSPSDVAYWCTNWWMNSPEHRSNIMDPRFDAHATGFYRTDAGKVLGVELFGKTKER